MKKLFSVVMVLAMTLALTSAALAAVPAPGGPFNSAFRVQNLEDTDAQCSYTFYNADGSDELTSTTETVAPGDSLYVYVPGLAGLGTGSYSAVVSCDKKVAAVTNFSDADSGASHEGITEPAMVWYAPGIYDNFFTYYSDVVVQNASAGLVDITIEIFQPGNAVPVYTDTAEDVPANAAVSFEQEGLTELVNNQFYSAKISGTGNIAPIVNIYGGGGNNQLYSYNAFKSGSTLSYAPIIMNKYYGYDTSLVVQNVGDAAAEVTVTYTNGDTDDYTIQPGAAESIYTPAVLPAGNILYGATVESTNGEEIVVLVNQSNEYNRAASYTGSASGAGEMRAPIVMKNYYTFDSSVVCQNLGAPATMTIEYAGIAATTTSPVVATGAIHQFYQPGDPVLAGVAPNWISSATVTSAGEIVCVVNQDHIPALATNIVDQLYSYEGIAP